ncbi:MAG TPA: hypothetical protein VGV38_12235, partial [Pyrinomonadaceae bacterium]|nr:hypothetical protein [Pyrinomonadaceae bacterium]
MPYSGTLAHQSNIVGGIHQHYFYGATQTLSVNVGDRLFAYVYLDPANMPAEIMLQWNNGNWEHRAYWGANNIPWGVDGTESRRHMGPLPALGQWVRLEVPANMVGLEGSTLNGMAFTLYGGRATWDHAGKISSVAPSPTPTPTPVTPPSVGNTIVAEVVALDQVFFYNRLGAFNPAGMIYALKRDVVPINPNYGLTAGNVRLRDGKRPRPLILRMNVGQKLEIRFQNLLAPNRANDNQPNTRDAGVHAIGLQLVNSILDDGSNVGNNPPSLVPPGGSITYTYFAEREGNHLFYSTAATTGGEGDGGSLAMGLFGMVNVEPQGAEWYRSQVTQEEMAWATVGRTPAGQPVINYDAVYPNWHARAGLPIIRILHGNEIVHGDLNAIITGPNKGRFPEGTYRSNPAEPDRNQPFREFSTIYHDEIKAVQAFPQFFEDPILAHTLHSVRDAFAINYGTGGIGAEILANRLGVGPMANCTECLYEEFFLSSWTVGDPAQIVDVPANTTGAGGQLITGPKATKVLFPEDPSNVHHGYLNDHTKMRVVHA